MIFRHLLACLALSLAITACATTGLPSSPGAVASQTVKDEQAILAVELAYKAARLSIETGVDAGLIKGERATQFAALDNRAYSAVQIARDAYAAGNAADYVAAVARARSAVEAMLALAGT